MIASCRRPTDGSTIDTFRWGDEEFLVVSLPPQSRADLRSLLTSAEYDVAVLVARGLSNGEIASRRKTATRTVANQLASIYRKTGISTRVELAASLGRLSES